MIPSDPHREVIDPRRLIREHGREALAELVAREAGYIFQLRPLKDLCQSLKSGMPLLAEGIPDFSDWQRSFSLRSSMPCNSK